ACPVPAGPSELTRELAVEAVAVEQPCQRVVSGEVLELALEALALVDVLGLADAVQRCATVVTDERGGHEHPDDATVGGEPAQLALEARDLAGHQPGHLVGVSL